MKTRFIIVIQFKGGMDLSRMNDESFYSTIRLNSQFKLAKPEIEFSIIIGETFRERSFSFVEEEELN